MAEGVKPLIGLTCNYIDEDTVGLKHGIGVKKEDWNLVSKEYVDAIVKAGAIPVLIPVFDDEDVVVHQLVDRLDGIVFTGGSDIDANIYGQFNHKSVKEIYPNRDKQEMKLLKYCIEKNNIPILGICRGLQIINATMGGTLIQDLVSENYENHSMSGAPMNYATHTVQIKEGSRLNKIIGKSNLSVNSYHHQAAKDIAPQFFVSAESEDGVVEAIEMKGERYVLAVQWHPEMMFDSIDHQKIFKEFVENAKHI